MELVSVATDELTAEKHERVAVRCDHLFSALKAALFRFRQGSEQEERKNAFVSVFSARLLDSKVKKTIGAQQEAAPSRTERPARSSVDAGRGSKAEPCLSLRLSGIDLK